MVDRFEAIKKLAQDAVSHPCPDPKPLAFCCEHCDEKPVDCETCGERLHYGGVGRKDALVPKPHMSPANYYTQVPTKNLQVLIEFVEAAEEALKKTIEWQERKSLGETGCHEALEKIRRLRNG